MGTNAVGAMIVAGPEGFQKNQYRKFNIRSADLTPGDDFAMMREVLERRFKRLMTESPRRAGGHGGAAGAVHGTLVHDGTFGTRRGLRHLAPLAGRGSARAKRDPGEGGSSRERRSRRVPLTPTLSPQAGRGRSPRR